MELVNRILYSAACVASILFLFLRSRLSYWKDRGILHLPPKYLWGNVRGVGTYRHITHALQEVYEMFIDAEAPFVGFYLLDKPMVMVLKLDLIQRILLEDFEYFSERGLYSSPSLDPFTENLMQLDGEEWKKLRIKLCPVFKNGNLSKVYPKLFQVASSFRETLNEKKNEKSANISDLVERYNVNVIASLSFGLENLNSHNNLEDNFRSTCHNHLEKAQLITEYLSYAYPNIANIFHYHSVEPNEAKFFSEIINNILEKRRIDKLLSSQNDFLQILVNLEGEANQSGSSCFERNQIIAQAFSFLHIGLEALNSTMTFCLYELALQPKLQYHLRSEIKSTLKRHNDVLSEECLKEMTFLDQVLCETWRLHPPYTFLLRKTKQDYEIQGSEFMLKGGDQLIIPVAAIHHDPQIYPMPTQFNPDNFNADLMKERHPMAWLPFGHGPRNCIAFEFVKMQVLVGLVTLLRDFDFSISPDTELPLKYDVTRVLLRPGADLLLEMKKDSI